MNAEETAVIAKIAFGPWPHYELTAPMLESYELGLEAFEYEDAYRGVGLALRVALFPPPPAAIRAEAMRFVRQRQERKIAQRRLRLVHEPPIEPARVRELLEPF